MVTCNTLAKRVTYIADRAIDDKGTLARGLLRKLECRGHNDVMLDAIVRQTQAGSRRGHNARVGPEHRIAVNVGGGRVIDYQALVCAQHQRGRKIQLAEP